MTRARARQGQNLTREAIADSRAAVDTARHALDPALKLATLSTLLDLRDPTNWPPKRERCATAYTQLLPGDTMKRRFESSEIVRRLAS